MILVIIGADGQLENNYVDCKICRASSNLLFIGELLRKYQVSYFQCTECGFIQTESPYWLGEAYANAICDVDLGPVNRAIKNSVFVENIVLSFFNPNEKFVDWGGGYGVFTRLMRDLGYDFNWQDLHCQNLFAKQFVYNEAVTHEALTAFEVFEHLPDPMIEIEKMLSHTKNIIFSTNLIPPNTKSLKDWWYFAPETGQHVAFYTARSLQYIANCFDLHFYSDGSNNHLLAKKKISQTWFNVMVRQGRTAGLARRVLRRRLEKQSRLLEDFRMVTGWNV